MTINKIATLHNQRMSAIGSFPSACGGRLGPRVDHHDVFDKESSERCARATWPRLATRVLAVSVGLAATGGWP